jgi:hypothetical protein
MFNFLGAGQFAWFIGATKDIRQNTTRAFEDAGFDVQRRINPRGQCAMLWRVRSNEGSGVAGDTKYTRRVEPQEE